MIIFTFTELKIDLTKAKISLQSKFSMNLLRAILIIGKLFSIIKSFNFVKVRLIFLLMFDRDSASEPRIHKDIK